MECHQPQRIGIDIKHSRVCKSICTSYYGKTGGSIMDPVYGAFQRIRFVFVGQFSFYMMQNNTRIIQVEASLQRVLVLLRNWNVLQLDVNSTLDDHLRNLNYCEQIFKLIPSLALHLSEFINHTLQGIELNTINVYDEDYETESEMEYCYGGDRGDESDSDEDWSVAGDSVHDSDSDDEYYPEEAMESSSSSSYETETDDSQSESDGSTDAKDDESSGDGGSDSSEESNEEDASNSSDDTRSDEDDDLQQEEVNNVHEQMDIEDHKESKENATKEIQIQRIIEIKTKTKQHTIFNNTLQI
eukprot:381976_1